MLHNYELCIHNHEMNKTMRKFFIIPILLASFLVSKSENKANLFVDSLLNVMTVHEKIGQLNQLHCENWQRLEEYTREGAVGSVMSITNPEMFNQIQRVAVEQSRLGIPLINARDVIHGFKTIFPIPLGQAASFDRDLVAECASVAASEASAAGIRWTFAPMVDICHDPRWGRIAEGFGEDPYLASTLGAEMVKGFQGDNLSDPCKIAACAKHFAAYGAAEGGRDYNSTFVSQNRMRNLYLRPFKACVDAGVATIMTSFNDNDGVPSSGNKWLLTDVLRNEWGFEGVVVSDWASITEMIDHGFCADRKEAALKAFDAGVDVDMVSDSYTDYLEGLLDEKKVSMKAIDDAVRRVLMLKYKLGLFENPYCDDSRYEYVIGSDYNLLTSLKAAEESLVLLKNKENLLPLNLNGKKILMIGPLADAPREQLGTWVFDGDPRLAVTPLAALRNLLGEENVIYDPILNYSRDKSEIPVDRLTELCDDVDLVISVVGEEAILSGEAHCLSDIGLQGSQSELLRQLSILGKPLVTVVIAGRPLDISDEIEWTDALIYSFAPGSMGGPAIINTIVGENNPSGKLPVTFPMSVGQIPIYYNHNNTGRPASGNEIYLRDIPVGAEQTALGNKSYYLDGNKPLFQFGDGMSYTEFKYSNLKINSKKFNREDTITLSFSLSNIGPYDGTEIIQVYIKDKASTITRPVLELIHFDRIELGKRETKEIVVDLPIESLAYWNGTDWTVEPGEFEIYVGGNSHELLMDKFIVEE